MSARSRKSREKVYSYVKMRLEQGTPPTIREIQKAVGFKAIESARIHLRGLVEEGRLVRQPGRARGLQLPHDELAHLPKIPILGAVQAGEWTTAVEDPEGYIAVDSSYPSEDLFALRVRGESMKDAGILPGDIVVAQKCSAADSGQTVIALVEEEATVKKLLVKRGRPELHPANEEFEVLRPDPKELQILGRVIQVHRELD